MANENKITVVISADPSGAITGIRLAGDETEKFGKRTTSTIERLKANWKELTVGAIAAYAALQKVWSAAEGAAELQEKFEVLDRLTARYAMTGEQLARSIQANSGGLIGMGSAANVAADALSKGFTPEQVTRMASWAETLHHTSAEGVTAAEAFKTLEGSLVAARERGMVKFIGAEIDLKSALGARYEMMSKVEKSQAAFNLVGEVMVRRQAEIGEMAESAADRMQKFKNSMDEAKFFAGQLALVIGGPLMAVFNFALMFAYGLAGALGNVAGAIGTITDAIGLTENVGARAFAWADKQVERSARQATQGAENIKGALAQLKMLGQYSSGEGAGAGGGAGAGSVAAQNAKKQEQINEIMRKYAEERDLIDAAEKDKELIRLNFWYDEQVKKLRELGAAQNAYDSLHATYLAKRHDAIAEQESKTSDFYLAEQRRINDEAIKIQKDADEAKTREAILAVETRLQVERIGMAAAGKDASAMIQQRAAGEREILSIKEKALIDSITENTTFEQTLAIMWQVRDIQGQIEASKRTEVADLDARRLELEQQIRDLKREQLNLVREMNFANAQKAFSNIGGGEFIQKMEENVKIDAGIKDITTGQDPYSIHFQKWSEMQDKKIMAMEEFARVHGDTEQLMRERSEAYAEYELRAEQTLQQQKIAMAGNTFGMMGSLAEAFYNMSGKKGGAAFELMKAFRIGEAMMNTFSAAIGAYNALASIPYVGPALGAAAAAAAIAFGMAQVSAISSMKPGGSSRSASISAGGFAGGAPSPPPAIEPQEKPEKTGPSIINFYIAGDVVDHDQFARSILPYLNKAQEAGVY